MKMIFDIVKNGEKRDKLIRKWLTVRVLYGSLSMFLYKKRQADTKQIIFDGKGIKGVKKGDNCEQKRFL